MSSDSQTGGVRMSSDLQTGGVRMSSDLQTGDGRMSSVAQTRGSLASNIAQIGGGVIVNSRDKEGATGTCRRIIHYPKRDGWSSSGVNHKRKEATSSPSSRVQRFARIRAKRVDGAIIARIRACSRQTSPQFHEGRRDGVISRAYRCTRTHRGLAYLRS